MADTGDEVGALNLACVVDTTGSMSGLIAPVSSAISRLGARGLFAVER